MSSGNTDASRYRQRPTDEGKPKEKEPVVGNPMRLAELEELRGDGDTYAVSLVERAIIVNLPFGYRLSVMKPGEDARLRVVPMVGPNELHPAIVAIDRVAMGMAIGDTEAVGIVAAAYQSTPQQPSSQPTPADFVDEMRSLAATFLSGQQVTRAAQEARAERSLMMADIEQILTMQKDNCSTPELDRRLQILLRKLKAMNDADEAS